MGVRFGDGAFVKPCGSKRNYPSIWVIVQTVFLGFDQP